MLYRGDMAALRHSMEMLADISCEFIAITAGADRLEKEDLAPGPKISFRRAHVNGNLSESLNDAVKGASGEWILLMNSDETISASGVETLKSLIHDQESAYYVRSQKRLVSVDAEAAPKAFEWVGQKDKYRSPEVRKHDFFRCLETRLFKRELFDQIFIQHDGSFAPVFKKTLPSVPVCGVEIELYPAQPHAEKAVEEEDQGLADYKRFVGETEEDLSKYAGFEFLLPNNIGYSLVREKDMPGLAAGLDMGFGRVEILKFMLHALIKKGAFDEAIAFSDAITQKLGDHIDIWRLKGSAYFYRLDLAHAEVCYRKALAIKKDDPETEFNLAKVLLIAKEFDGAKEILLKLTAIETWSEEIAYILDALSERPQETATLSLLMLCKDEAEYMERALASVRDVVDEIVVVDTGSTDETRAIAEAFGAKVIDDEWRCDFGAARNAGLAHASGDYVLWMDADEFIDNETRIALLVLKRLLPLERPKGVIVNIETYKEVQKTPNPVPPEKVTTRTALFPRRSEVYFTKEIFESVDGSLTAAGIDRLVARNIRFFHISENTEQRKERKGAVLNRCRITRFDGKDLIRGICFWLDTGNLQQAVEWFEHLIEIAGRDRQYDGTIGHLMEIFIQEGVLGIESPAFKKLKTDYRDSYGILSKCAHLLYHSGAYHDAVELFKNLPGDGNGASSFRQNGSRHLIDKAYFAAANLEIGNIAHGDTILENLLDEDNMVDTCSALRFYSEVRKNDIEKGIGILDTWIKTRNITIKETIDSFLDLIHAINRIAEAMTTFGQTDATHFLYRSTHYLSEKIIRNGHV
jgi:glycosyltransferase involved in cell wall biosynthesis